MMMTLFLGKLPEVYKEYEITIDKFNATFEWRMKSPTDYYGDDDHYHYSHYP